MSKIKVSSSIRPEYNDLLRIFDDAEYALSINSLAKVNSKALYEDKDYNKYFANYHITKLKLQKLILEIPNAIALSKITQFGQGKVFAKKRTSFDGPSGFTSIMVSDLDESSTDIYIRKASGYIESLNVNSISPLKEKCVLVCLVRKLKPKIFDPNNFNKDIYINKKVVAIYPSESYSVEYILYLLSSPIINEQINLLRAKNKINIKTLRSIKVSLAETVQEQQRFILSHKMALIEQEESRVVKLRDALELKEKQEEAEFEIVRHIAHNLNPKLSEVSSVLNSLKDYLRLHNLLEEKLYEPLDDDDGTERIGDAISSAMNRVDMMHRLIRSTRSLVVDRVSEDDFKLVEPFKFLNDILSTLNSISRNARVQIKNNSRRKNIKIKANHDYLRELFENLVRNSNTHGFLDFCTNNQILITIDTFDDSIVFDYTNNGKPLPDDLNVDSFLQYGVKGIDSPGDGLGGAFIRKVLNAHNGEFEIIKNIEGANFKLILPLYIGEE